MPSVASRMRIGKLEAADLFLAHEVDRQQQRRQRADQRQRLHEAAEGVVDEGAVEGDARRAVVGEHRDERGGEQRGGDFRHQPDRAFAAQRAEEHQRERAGRDDEFGQDDRERESGHVHVLVNSVVASRAVAL